MAAMLEVQEAAGAFFSVVRDVKTVRTIQKDSGGVSEGFVMHNFFETCLLRSSQYFNGISVKLEHFQ